MEGPVLGLTVGLVRTAENLQCFVLRGGRECVVAGVGQHLARSHNAVDGVLNGLVFIPCPMLRKSLAHPGGGPTALTGVCLVNDDRERAASVCVADLLVDERELL